MQFIDQSATYSQKSISPARAVETGRANLTLAPGAERLAVCLRAELDIANTFDRRINERVKFFDLPTPAKLDLMVEELLPGFFHPDLLGETGRERWHVRFVVDGTVRRSLHLDAAGIRAVPEGPQDKPDIEVETDIVTLLAMLRHVIALHHTGKPVVTNARVAGRDDGQDYGQD